MSRAASPYARGRPHLPVEDPTAPGCCAECHRPMTAANDRHIDQLPATDPAARAEEQRRLGETDE